MKKKRLVVWEEHCCRVLLVYLQRLSFVLSSKLVFFSEGRSRVYNTAV